MRVYILVTAVTELTHSSQAAFNFKNYRFRLTEADETNLGLLNQNRISFILFAIPLS